MSHKDPVVKGIEKVLDLLPNNLTDDEKQKVDEIKEMLDKIASKCDNTFDR